jgi:hypothetical protein
LGPAATVALPVKVSLGRRNAPGQLCKESKFAEKMPRFAKIDFDVSR